MIKAKTILAVAISSAIMMQPSLSSAKSYKSYKSSSSYSSSKSSSYSKPKSNSYSKPKSNSYSKPKSNPKTVSTPKSPASDLKKKSKSAQKVKVGAGIAVGAASAGAVGASLSSSGSSSSVSNESSSSNVLPVKAIPSMNAAEKTLYRKAVYQQSQKKKKELEQTKLSSYGKLVSESGGVKINDINRQRKRYYEDHYYSKPSNQHMMETRSYGSLDGGFLTTMLMSQAMGREAGDAMLWYSLTGSPAMAMFLSDSKKEAVDSNDQEMLARINKIEKDNARLASEGVKQKDPLDYIADKGIPAAVALAPDVLSGVESSLHDVKFYTGSEGGMYKKICSGLSDFSGLKQIGSEYGVTVDCVISKGGVENLRKSATGAADILIAQSDVVEVRRKDGLGIGGNEYPLYKEPFLMIAGEDGNVGEVSDINEDTTVYLYGSAQASWDSIVTFATNDTFLGFGGNQDYAKAKIKLADDLDSAIKKVKSDDDAILFLVMAPESEKMQLIDKKYGDELKLIAMDDDRFLNMETDAGNPVYSQCEIKSVLPKMQSGGFWGTGSVETICVDALLIVNNGWVEGLSKTDRNLVGSMISDVLQEIGYLNLGK